MVHRRRVRCCHRLGANRLDGRLHDAHQRRRRLRPVGQPRDPVQRPAGRCRAVDAVGAFVKNPDYLGGENAVQGDRHHQVPGRRPRRSSPATAICTARRASTSGSFPEGTTFAPDGDMWFFYLPSPADGPKFVLGAGDVYSAATDKPESFDVLRYTGSVPYQTHIVNARKELVTEPEPRSRPTSRTRSSVGGRTAGSADVFRFDGSDLMPGAVGSATFWTEITAWVIGGSTDRTSSTTSRPAGPPS